MCCIGKKEVYRFCAAVLMLLAMCLPAPAYAAEPGAGGKTVTAQIPVSCTGTNTTEQFVFRLTGESSPFQTVENETLILKDKEKGFFRITYTYPGTYHYTVSQEKGKDSATTYDDTVYCADVYVAEDEKGNLYADPVVYIEGESEKKAELSFFNEKKKPEKQPDQPEEQPGQPEKQSNQPGNMPKTGDDTPLFLCVLLMVVSGAAGLIIWQMVRIKKRGERSA